MNPVKELRPGEKAVGYTVVGLAAAGLAYGVAINMAAILAFAWGLVSLSIAAGVLFVFGYAVLDSSLRTAVGLGFRAFTRGMSKYIIRMDPISVAKDYVIMLKKKLQRATKKLGELTGVMKDMRDTIDKLKKEFQEAANMTRAAEKTGDQRTKVIQGSISKATGEAIIDLEARYDRLVKCRDMISKLIDNDDLVIQVTENNVRVLNIRFGAAKAAGDAFDAAYAIAQQDPEMREQYDTACEEATKIIAERMGMMELLTDGANSMIRGIDVRNAMIDDTALSQIEAFEARLFAPPPAAVATTPGIDLAAAMTQREKTL